MPSKRDNLTTAHRRAAAPLGQLALMIARGTFRPSVLLGLAGELETAAVALRTIVEEARSERAEQRGPED